MKKHFKETYNRNGIQEFEAVFVSETADDSAAPAAPMMPALNPQLQKQMDRASDANGVALQTAIDNANKFRGERDTLQKELEKVQRENRALLAQLKDYKPKVEAPEESIARAKAMFGIK
jgi:hypothetical protein